MFSDGDHLIIAEDVVTDRERHLQATPNKNEPLSKSGVIFDFYAKHFITGKCMQLGQMELLCIILC